MNTMDAPDVIHGYADVMNVSSAYNRMQPDTNTIELRILAYIHLRA
jgi:hypothetical protein